MVCGDAVRERFDEFVIAEDIEVFVGQVGAGVFDVCSDLLFFVWVGKSELGIEVFGDGGVAIGMVEDEHDRW